MGKLAGAKAGEIKRDELLHARGGKNDEVFDKKGGGDETSYRVSDAERRVSSHLSKD